MPSDFPQQLPEPTKDELALVNGRPVSIDRYLTLRSALKEPSNEVVFWIAMAGVAIESETQERISPSSAINVARYAAGDASRKAVENSLREYLGTRPIPNPAELRTEIEQLLTRTVIKRNREVIRQVLAEIHR